MSETYLRFSNVFHAYDEGAGKLEILKGADLEILSGELVALVAPSGAGKSTLLHIGGLLDRAGSGDVEVCGHDVSTMADRARTMLRRSSIGFVYQFHHLLPEFTALENVAIPQLIAGVPKADAEARAHSLLDDLGVAPRAHHRPSELSGGEQQRVAIARAAANTPQLILADEPTGNLDPATSDLVFEALVKIIKNTGASALIVTHDHGLAKRADRVITLKNGKIDAIKL